MATKKKNYHSNYQQNEIQNAVDQNLASAPSSPKEGQFYWNTSTKQDMIYNGTSWVSRTSQGKVYTAGNGINTTSFASDEIAVYDASVTQKGIVEYATDSEAATGTATDLVINPKQLATKVTANAAITAGAGTVITYDAKGLVTAGTNIGVDSGSSNYMSFSTSTYKFSLNVDTTVGTNTNYLVTSGAVKTYVDNAVVGGVKYNGTWDITSATDLSGITLPVKKGYLYYVTGTGPKTIDGIEWNAGDYLMVNADVASGGSLSGKVEKVDNTESADIVRLNATQTITNKTIDADNNTISDLTTSNLKSGVLQTTVRAASSASDSSIPSEKAVATAITGMAKKLVATNPALTASGGQCTWEITNTLGTDECGVFFKLVSTNEYEDVYYEVTSSKVTIKINSASNISAGTYKAIIVG